MENDNKLSLAARKEKAATEGRKALAETQAQDLAVRKNMARLKALRLAKEAVDREANIDAPPAAKAKPKKAKAAPKAVAKKAVEAE
jgi:hypothetical protein